MRQGSNFFGSSAHILNCESVMDIIREIALQPGQDEPFYVLNVGDLVQKVKMWRLLMPRIKPFYAVKCNNNATVLKVLAALGTGFDCASKAEMEKISELGVESSRIIYAHPCKPVSHLQHAVNVNVTRMTFDNVSELHKVKATYPAAELILRIRCDAKEALCPLGMKFGVFPKDAEKLLEIARDLGLNIAGVAFHVGSGCQEPEVFHRAVGAAKEVFDKAAVYGFAPYILDIGGGFPGADDRVFREMAVAINEALAKYFPEPCEVEVIAEPGRYFVSSAFTLATGVVSKRDIFAENGILTSAMYYINDGIYGSFNCLLYDHRSLQPLLLQDGNDEDYFHCSIWGPTCDGLDQVVSDAFLPQLSLGSWLVWPNMGAYTIAAAGTFNGFPVPVVHIVVPQHTWQYLEEYLGAAHIGEGTDDSKMSEVSSHNMPLLTQCGSVRDCMVSDELHTQLTLINIADGPQGC